VRRPWQSLPTQFSCHFQAKNRECHGYRAVTVATAMLHLGMVALEMPREKFSHPVMKPHGD
jgi:hypothetical protein